MVAFRVGQHHPRNVALPDVHTRCSERDQSFNFGGLIVGTKIDMQTVTVLLWFIDGQEQDPRQSVWLWLNLEHRRIVVDDNPSECFAPPATERSRVSGGHHDLFPLKAHAQTIYEPLPRAVRLASRHRRSSDRGGADPL